MSIIKFVLIFNFFLTLYLNQFLNGFLDNLLNSDVEVYENIRFIGKIEIKIYS